MIPLCKSFLDIRSEDSTDNRSSGEGMDEIDCKIRSNPFQVNGSRAVAHMKPAVAVIADHHILLRKGITSPK
jgi:hypothetical protein